MVSLLTIRRGLEKARRQGKTWRAIGLEWGISGGMAYRIVMHDYDPHDAHIRARLGLPSLIPAPACPKCGDVHVSKICTANRSSKRQPTCYGCANMGEPYRNWRKLGHADGCPWGDKPKPGVTVIEREWQR